jgi:hypothetical protein
MCTDTVHEASASNSQGKGKALSVQACALRRKIKETSNHRCYMPAQLLHLSQHPQPNPPGTPPVKLLLLATKPCRLMNLAKGGILPLNALLLRSTSHTALGRKPTWPSSMLSLCMVMGV